MAMNGHCSVLIKLPGDMSDIWAGHSTWLTFSSMNRLYKHWNFRLNSNTVVSRKMSFSSYPATLASTDDFYMMDSGLAMLQTTNSIFNYSLYNYVHPSSLLAWQRVRLANMMAHDGMEWGAIFDNYNSGTYNNQYMIVDYNKFEAGVALNAGALVVVEQIPGLIIYADQTSQLERGYWASYNIPFYEQIYNLSGYPAMYNSQGWQVSYQMCPRCQIFRRDQGNVVDLPSFQAMMRYNDYKNDPVSKGNPGNSVCSRFDLLVDGPVPFGCTDSKVTSMELITSLTSWAVSGPTTSHNLPPFQWTAEFNSSIHEGEPDVFDFDFVQMSPEWED